MEDSLLNEPALEHVVILHEKIARRRCDRYIANLSLALQRVGYKVTIYTSKYNEDDCLEDFHLMDRLDIKYSGSWIPCSLFGFFRQEMSMFKSLWMAFRMIIYPPKPKPAVILLDTSLQALYTLKVFSAFKVIYLENSFKHQNADCIVQESNVLKRKCLQMADDIIVETVGFLEIFQKCYPSFRKKPKVLYPSIDIGLWCEPRIKIQRIIPDLTPNTILFLTVGKYRKSSNLKLSLEAFEMLLDSFEDKAQSKRFQLVIAGNCKSLEEQFYHNEIVASLKNQSWASQVTFLNQLPVIHEKTLISKSSVIIHPAINDVYSDFLLRAMCLGKPIVATNQGIASKILSHRLSGLILEADAKEFSLAMKKLILTPNLQTFLGDVAEETFVNLYSFNSLCEQVKKMIMRHVQPKEYTIKLKK